MAVARVLRLLRDLKREGLMEDYLLFGSVAVMAHTRPFYTRDIDVAVDVPDDQAFLAVFSRLASIGRVEGHAIVIDGTPVEVFPADISPIIKDAVNHHPLRKRVEGVMVKVASPEHLLVEALRVHRARDKGRVFILDEVINRERLAELFRRLDGSGTLERRYQDLVGKTSESAGE